MTELAYLGFTRLYRNVFMVRCQLWWALLLNPRVKEIWKWSNGQYLAKLVGCSLD